MIGAKSKIINGGHPILVIVLIWAVISPYGINLFHIFVQSCDYEVYDRSGVQQIHKPKFDCDFLKYLHMAYIGPSFAYDLHYIKTYYQPPVVRVYRFIPINQHLSFLLRGPPFS